MTCFTNALKETFTARWNNLRGLQGVIAVENRVDSEVWNKGSDLLLLIVTEGPAKQSFQHFMKDGIRVQEHHIDRDTLEQWVTFGSDRTIIPWIIQGEILVDLDAYLITLRSKLAEMPQNWKERQLLIEYSSFLNKYLQCKEFLAREEVLDAYSSIADAMHHWAHIIIIEKGMQPGVNVWEQVKHIKIGVYKLYEELTTSRETVKQRVELVLLACEFSVMSKMETCCSPIIRILEESAHPLDVKELQQHDSLEYLRERLPLILNKMAKKALIREVAVSSEDDFSVLELKYTKIV